mgnify:CR=1 FL=1
MYTREFLDSIMKAYDVRGLVDKQITADFAFVLGTIITKGGNAPKSVRSNSSDGLSLTSADETGANSTSVNVSSETGTHSTSAAGTSKIDGGTMSSG